MQFKEEIFALVSVWKSRGLTKNFLADQHIKLTKFNYWWNRFNEPLSSITLNASQKKFTMKTMPGWKQRIIFGMRW